MNSKIMFESEARGIYFEDGLQLCILKENKNFWLTRAQLCAIFSCDEQRIQVAMARLRRQENFVFRDMVSAIPLILQRPSAHSHKLCENVRSIQHFNQAMVTHLARYIPSIHIERFLYWCEFLSKNSWI